MRGLMIGDIVRVDLEAREELSGDPIRVSGPGEVLSVGWREGGDTFVRIRMMDQPLEIHCEAGEARRDRIGSVLNRVGAFIRGRVSGR